jgi:hypothetical protein
MSRLENEEDPSKVLEAAADDELLFLAIVREPPLPLSARDVASLTSPPDTYMELDRLFLIGLEVAAALVLAEDPRSSAISGMTTASICSMISTIS